MMKTLKLLFLLIIGTGIVRAQTLKTNFLVDKIDAFNKIYPSEKIYLSFDKPYYNVGDTLWFKTFLLNSDLTRNTRSSKVYIELYNDSLRLVTNRVVLLNNGIGYGDISLDRALDEGTYTIRAYSNWQQNFDGDYFFQKSFYVGNAEEKTWVFDSYQQLKTEAGKTTLNLKVRLTNLNNEVQGLKDLEIYLMNDKKRIMRAELRTTQEGLLETKIPLNNEQINSNYNFLIIDKKNPDHRSVLPVILNEVSDVDLQFMPEGGYMVNGIFGRIAFKALGTDGLGKDIKGKIVNSKNEEVAELTTTHKGMGSFYLLPQKGESYTAVYQSGKKEKKQVLPVAKDEGTTLRIDQLSKTDSLLIYVKASDTRKMANYELIALSANEMLMAVNLDLTNGFRILKLPKKDFPDGIIHFTLFSPQQQPLNERQVFINRSQQIGLQVSPHKATYHLRDSVSLDLTAINEEGKPLSGSFSIAVTDNNMVKQQNDDGNIVSYFLLQGDVKGNIEDAGWYFNNQEPSTMLALDNLLLTQGWIGYRWDQLLTPALPKFKAEKENIIEGSLTNAFKKPVPDINLTLLSLGKNIFTTDTISNAEGKFLFKDLPLLDSAAYTIKIKNAKGKTSNATIKVDEFKAAAQLTRFDRIIPWYVNPDSTLLNFFKTAEKQNRPYANLRLEGTTLKEVEIRSRTRAMLTDKTWDANLLSTITEAELKKTPRKTLLDLLKEQLPGLTISNYWGECFGRPSVHKYNGFVVGTRLVSSIRMDRVSTADVNPDDEFGTNDYLFNFITAQDVKRIDVYKGCSTFYVEILTRGGKGPWIGRSAGVYVYRPLPIYMPKEFYSPKYQAAKQITTPDLRSTIFWDANIVTDENGKTKIYFYTGDKPGSYTIKVEGTDLSGRFGYQKSMITVTSTTESK